MALFGGKKSGLTKLWGKETPAPKAAKTRVEPRFEGAPSPSAADRSAPPAPAPSMLPPELQGWAAEPPSPPEAAPPTPSAVFVPPTEPEPVFIPQQPMPATFTAPPENAAPAMPVSQPSEPEAFFDPLYSDAYAAYTPAPSPPPPPPAPKAPVAPPPPEQPPAVPRPDAVPGEPQAPRVPAASVEPSARAARPTHGLEALDDPALGMSAPERGPNKPTGQRPSRAELPSRASRPAQGRAPGAKASAGKPKPKGKAKSVQSRPAPRPQGRKKAGRGKQASQRVPIFPPEVRDSLRRTFWRLWGLMVVVIAGMLATALLTYNTADASLDTATHAETVKNALGLPGSYIADVLIQGFGLAGFFPVLLLTAWGLRQAAALPVTWLPLRLMAVLVGTMLLATAFVPLRLPVQLPLPLPSGMGGFVGLLTFQHVVLAAYQAQISRDVTWLVAGGAALLALPVLAWAMELRWREARNGVHSLADLGRAAGSSARRIRSAADDVARASLDKVIGQRPLEPGRRPRDGVERSLPEPILVSETGEEISPAEAAWREQKAAAAAAAAAADQDAFDNQPTAIARTIVTPTRRNKKASTEPAMLRPDTNDGFRLPSLELLRLPIESSVPPVKEQVLERNARQLESVLAEFGVNGQVVEVRPGPVVTHYELCPTPGTKAARVVGLADDIARLMDVSTIRIAAMPGNSTIGIEIPNGRRERINFRELLAEDEFRAHEHALTLALGRDIGGEPIFADLSRMPHLLLAGGPSTGKTMALHTMICSLLYRLTPEQCRMILIDSKGGSLGAYADMPHLLTPVLYDPGPAIIALKWVLKEMENRNRVMSSLEVRTIASYNARLRDAVEKGQTLTRTVQVGFDSETDQPKYEEQELDMTPLPFLVVVVDEMAMLMTTAGKAMEQIINRLSQVSRAGGVHLVMATRQVIPDVITPTVTANFSARIAFQVETKVDSRTLLGEAGAENLLKPGDMLYLAQGGRTQRVHAPYISPSEIETVVAHLQAEGEPSYVTAVLDDNRSKAVINLTDKPKIQPKTDENLFKLVVDLVARERKASTSYVQRTLGLSYNQASEIIASMEEKGMISKANYRGVREVLLPAPPKKTDPEDRA